MTAALEIKSLTLADLPRLMEFWRASFPMHPMNLTLLAERVFGPPDSGGDNILCVPDGQTGIAALALLEPPSRRKSENGDHPGGIRWLGVHPFHRRKGIGSALLERSVARLSLAGATCVDFLSTPPYYIQPGVDIRLTSLIAWLQRRGFRHRGTHFNMTLDLTLWTAPSFESIFAADAEGYLIRRAAPEDRAAFAAYCEDIWTVNWRDEASQGLTHDPVSLFLAVCRSSQPKAEEIAGFAVYEANQCLGCFGPTGVSPDHQGHGLGRRLLNATLLDMKSLGRTDCQIGWVGPVDFYHRACGAILGPTFWAMRRDLKGADQIPTS